MNYSGKFDAAIWSDGAGTASQKDVHVETVHAHAPPPDSIIVPDAHFLFNADFKRSGVDLILSTDERELVLHDYFKGEKRAALASPDGAHLTGNIVNALTGAVEYSQAGAPATAGQVIGHVTKLTGSATAVRNGVSIILNMGDNVEKGDVVQSGANSTLGITFIDGTVFGLSSNARMVLNEMVYDSNGSNNSSLLSLVAGTITFVAGETAKHGDMKVDTPVATMGIRGTAVLVEIDFTVPGQNATPDAKFQVLVEPDGSTGSYILFDKTTLQPIATVNQAGQQINISQGVISQTSAPLSPEIQKLITDVFSLKFSENTNTKTTTVFNDSIDQQQLGPLIKLAGGAQALPIFAMINPGSGPTPQTSGPGFLPFHIPGPPTAVVLNTAGIVTSSFAVNTGDGTNFDTVIAKVNFVDVNFADRPTVAVTFNTFRFAVTDATGQTVTPLSSVQMQDIIANEIKVAVDPAPGNNNNGSATLIFSMVDKAFDFLAPGDTLTLTYLVKVDTNYAPDNEETVIPVTITITATTDAPVITSGPQTIKFFGGTSVPGGALTSGDPTSGQLLFTDVNPNDRHTVTTALTSAVMSDGSTVPPGPLKIFESALSASLDPDSTGTGAGKVDWTLASLPAYLADFIPKGQTLTLTYIVTVGDPDGSATQTVTVSITGTDNPAVVWIATTTGGEGEASGGLWSDPANWETGTVPTASDDVIIVTNQLIGLTPSFPVTIDAPAFAKSLTMNDFGTSPPELINNNTLSIGGALTLSADSILHNAGNISVGGAAEFLDHSVLVNFGTFVLENGGDFKDQASITNESGGQIEIAGGTLNVLVDVANSGGLFKVDSEATLALKSGIIDGGSVTICGTLNLEGDAVLKNGSLANFAQVKVSGSGNALEHETVTANNAFEILAGGALAIDQGSSFSNTGGTITIDSTAILTLNDATIDGGTVTENESGTIDLTGNAVLKNGALGIGGQINVSGFGNALDNEIITVNDAVEILTSGALTIDHGSTFSNSGGAIQVDNFATLTVNDASIVGGIITNLSCGIISLTGSDAVKNGSLGNFGQINVSCSDNALDSEDVGNESGAIVVTGFLKLDLGTVITGGTLTNSGTLDIESSAGATLNDVSVANACGTIQIDTTLLPATTTLTVEGGTTIANGTININSAGTLEVSTLDEESALADATLSCVTVNSSGTFLVDPSAVLSLQGTAISGGLLVNFGTLDSTGTSLLHDVTITNTGLLESTSGILTIDPDTPSTLTNDGMVEANGGELDITSEPVFNTSTLQAINDGTLKLTSTTVTNSGNGSVFVQGGSNLLMADATISGGPLNNAGTLDSSGTSALHNVVVNNSSILESISGTLTIDSASTIHNTGVLEAHGGNLVVDAEFSGAAEIFGASELDLGAGDSSSYSGAIITFMTGATGVLKLDHSEHFCGTVAGLDDNKLDLADIGSGKNTTVTFSGNASGGTLTIVDNAYPSQVAHINLTGDYLGVSWVANSDGSGGTTVAEVPGAISGLDSHGNAIQGVAVAALITDGGQPVSDVCYQWLLDGKTISGATGQSYTPGEADEGHALSVSLTYIDALGNPESSSASAGIVQEVIGGDLVATLDQTTAQQGVTIHVTGVKDGGVTVTSNLSYAWQESNNGGQSWTTVAHGSSFTPGEEDEGKLLQLVVTYAEATGSESVTYSLGMPNDLSVSLNTTTAQQGVPIRVTEVDDGSSSVSRGVTYSWQTSSDNQHWTTVGSASSFTPHSQDVGKYLQLVVNYVDPGENESVTKSLGIIASDAEWLPGSNVWETASHWSPSGVPTSSDNVVVDLGSEANYTLTVDHASTAQSLVVNTSSAKVEIVKGGSLTLGGDLVIDAGSVQVDAGGTLKDVASSATITGSFTDNGTVEAAGGTLEIASASVGGSGIYKIDAGATLQLDQANSHDVAFSGSGELNLNDPTHFSGKVSDSGGSMTVGDVLDLAGFDTKATVSYVGNKLGGSVIVSENNQVAVIKVGANSTNWSKPVSDGHGGILIHDPPATDSPSADNGVTPDTADNQVNRGTPTPFHDVITPKSSLAGNAILGDTTGDSFVFKPNFGKDGTNDPAHGTDLPQAAQSGLSNWIALFDHAHEDGNAHLSFPLDPQDILLPNGVKVQMLAHHGDYHVV